MDDIDDIFRNMQISTLRATLSLYKIEIRDVNLMVESSTSALLRREMLVARCARIERELAEIQEA